MTFKLQNWYIFCDKTVFISLFYEQVLYEHNEYSIITTHSVVYEVPNCSWKYGYFVTLKATFASSTIALLVSVRKHIYQMKIKPSMLLVLTYTSQQKFLNSMNLRHKNIFFKNESWLMLSLHFTSFMCIYFNLKMPYM